MSSSSTTETLITAEELANSPPDHPCELVEGRIVRMSPAGLPHGLVAARFNRALMQHLLEGDVGGLVVSAETGYLVRRDPDTVRAPDLAYLSEPGLSKAKSGFSPRPPDIAVEVMSPNDAWEAVEQKVEDYLYAGTRLVWVASPKGRKVYVYQAEKPRLSLTDAEQLTGGEVLPGFSVPVGELFG